jgi:hypothetical protein
MFRLRMHTAQNADQRALKTQSQRYLRGDCWVFPSHLVYGRERNLMENVHELQLKRRRPQLWEHKS